MFSAWLLRKRERETMRERGVSEREREERYNPQGSVICDLLLYLGPDS